MNVTPALREALAERLERALRPRWQRPGHIPGAAETAFCENQCQARRLPQSGAQPARPELDRDSTQGRGGTGPRCSGAAGATASRGGSGGMPMTW